MSLISTCTSCGARQSVEAGFAGDDAKRLAAITGDMQPALARVALAYLRLFKPPKTDLRLARAVNLLRELADLVNAGTVTKDERSALRRPATPAHWIAGIEQALVTSSLELPLDNHNYLRKIVYGLADKSDAAAEQEREASLRRGEARIAPAGVSPIGAPEDPLRNEIAYLERQLDYGQITKAQYEEGVEAAHARYRSRS